MSAAAALGLAALWVVQPPVFGRGRSEPVSETQLRVVVAGSEQSATLMGATIDALYASPGALRMRYLDFADRDARDSFATGAADVAVSGRPLSERDRQRLQLRNVSGTIDAPIGLGAIAFLQRPPTDGFQLLTPDPNDPDGGFFPPKIYTGPLRMPSSVFGANLLNLLDLYEKQPNGDRAQNPWQSAAFQKANGITIPEGGAFTPQGPTGSVWPAAVGADVYYLQRYVATTAPEAWATATKRNNVTPDVAEERKFAGVGRISAQQVVAAISLDDSLGGSTGVVTPGVASERLAKNPTSQADGKPIDCRVASELLVNCYRLLAVQNGAGEYLAPTPDSITAAGAAAAANPDGLPALTTSIPGAYPLVWVNRLYAPTNGLSAAKANAIASVIRFAATHGQDASVAEGGGRLPAALAAEAFAKADKLITSNCTGDGQRVVTVTGSGGPYWPTDVGAPDGPVTLCAVDAAATTTTTTAPETTADSSSSSGGSFSVSGSVVKSGSTSVSATASAGSTTATTTAAATTTTTVPPYVRTAMPLPMPSDGKLQFDRFGTMLIGALGYLVCFALFRAGWRRFGTGT